MDTTTSDARIIQDNMILVFGVNPKNIDLLATQEDSDQILKHIRIDDEDIQVDKLPEEDSDHILKHIRIDDEDIQVDKLPEEDSDQILKHVQVENEIIQAD